MLVQKLRIGNLQSDRGRYDGTMVYAQHKVRADPSYLTAKATETRGHVWASVCVSPRGSRWWWRSSLQRPTRTSTSPSCIPAGWTHRVIGRELNVTTATGAFSNETSLSLRLSQRWPTPCQTSTAPWRRACAPRSRGPTPWCGWPSLKLPPQTLADASIRVRPQWNDLMYPFVR